MLEENKTTTDHAAEIRRFYLQQKSTRAECEYGSKNCCSCKKDDCRIRQFVEK